MATFCRTHHVKVETPEDAINHSKAECILETEGSSMEMTEATTADLDIFPKIEKMDFKESDNYG